MLKIINRKSVANVKAIMKDRFPIMVEYFLEDTGVYIKRIDEGISANDAEMVKSPAHTIKSSAGQIGAEKVSEIAKQIEEIAINMLEGGEGDFKQLHSLFNELKAAFNEAEPELKKLIE